MRDLFPGFASRTIPTSSGGAIFARVGGSGPPLLCLHGYPETHAMWHRVAPRLAEHFTVIAADLRGYGASTIPPTGSPVAAYSKSAMGADMVEVMATLGFDRFRVLAHDRGARVAYRLMLERPTAVERAVLLDIIPTLDVWRSFAAPAAAICMSHWTFLALAPPLPESMIGGNPDHWLESRFIRGGAALPGWLDRDVYDHYRALHRDPARFAVHCNDYRAGATVDLDADRASRARGDTITQPLMVLWGSLGNLAVHTAPAGEPLADPLSVWRAWCPHVTGGPVTSSHYIPEDNPDALLATCLPFLRAA